MSKVTMPTGSNKMSRLADLIRFYELLGRLESRLGGKRTLSQCNGRLHWPLRGVYFFFEQGETRTGSGSGARVVRVGTHGLKAHSYGTLWQRLRSHRGTASGGNHRGSVFRLLLGAAIKELGGFDGVESWAMSDELRTAARRLGCPVDHIKAAELPLERRVNDYIRAMPFLWVPVADEMGPASDRGTIERGSIALLSCRHESIDPPSANWLGARSGRELVRFSGLWNSNHVDEGYDAQFLELLEQYVAKI